MCRTTFGTSFLGRASNNGFHADPDQMVWLVDFERDVTMFEGPIDAMFMENSIGLATAGRSTEEFDEIPTIQYMFDNDKTGKSKMVEKLKRGRKIFIWNKFLTETECFKPFRNNSRKNEKN